jgi:hypothetical protein
MCGSETGTLGGKDAGLGGYVMPRKSQAVNTCDEERSKLRMGSSGFLGSGRIELQ